MGRPRTIDRAQVLAAALAIADDEGLAAVTMASVSRRLGVTAMALYRHVRDKTDLLDGLVEQVLREIADGAPSFRGTQPCPDQRDWRGTLAALVRSAYQVAARHPTAFALVLTRPVRTTPAQEIRTGVHEVLRRAGVDARDVERLERIVTTTALGMALGRASARFGHHSPDALDEDLGALLTFVEAGLHPFRRTARPPDATRP